MADGVCDCYIRLGRTGEWDTAAAEILLAEMGGVVFDLNYQPLTYNQRESFVNPNFLMGVTRDFPWDNIFRSDLSEWLEMPDDFPYHTMHLLNRNINVVTKWKQKTVVSLSSARPET